MEFCLITAVWGSWHTDVFLNVCVPSLLAPGNIPALTQEAEGRYVIVTRESDRDRIRSSESFVALLDRISVDIVVYPDEFFQQNTHMTHAQIWLEQARAAAANGEWVVFISADLVWGDGALVGIGRQFRAGKRILYGLPLRVTEHTFMKALDSAGDRIEGSWVSAPRRLMEVAFEHLAPMHMCYMRDTRNFGHHPEYLLYPVEGEGIVFRAFMAHCFAVHAGYFDLTDGLSPSAITDDSAIGFLTDSDQFATVSITPIHHQTNWFNLKRRSSTINTAKLWHLQNNAATPYLSRQSFLFHYSEMTHSKWRPVIHTADNNVTLCYLAMKFTWALLALEPFPETAMARRLIAWSLVRLGLHRWCAARGKLSVLIPTDDLLNTLGAELLKGSRAALGVMLRKHCLLGDLAEAAQAGYIDTLAGCRMTVSRDGDSFWVNERQARRVVTDDVNGGNIGLFIYDGIAVAGA